MCCDIIIETVCGVLILLKKLFVGHLYHYSNCLSDRYQYTRLGHVEGKFTVAISNVVSSGLGHFEEKIRCGHTQQGRFWVRSF